jgi:serine/threonine protein kinase
MQFTGTPVYMAPELFLKKGYDEKIDVWAFGALLWEILTNEVPFEGLEAVHIMDIVTNPENLKENDLAIPYTMNEEMSQLIKNCRDFDPKKRPSFPDILETLNEILLV